MSKFIEEKLREWDSPESRETNLMIGYLERHLFRTYEVSLPPKPDFWARCALWIDNAGDDAALGEDLFNSLNHIFFVGPLEFNELYRTAYSNTVARWLIDHEGIGLDNPHDSMVKLKKAVATTWFCPISDSMPINKFYKINNIPARADFRPDWRALEHFANEDKIREYIQQNKFKYMVLLEDFVGSGTQMARALKFVGEIRDTCPVLVVPLIICPAGLNKTRQIANDAGIQMEPVLMLPEKSFVSKQPPDQEEEHMAQLRCLALKTYEKVARGSPEPADDDPFGYKTTGGLIVMYTNTPNNTLPMFHFESDTWKPIFPRHRRV